MTRIIGGAMIDLIAPTRGSDPWGAGHFGAPRGKHTHEGWDVAAWPGSVVRAMVAARIVRIGYCYASGVGGIEGRDPYRLIEMNDQDGNVLKLLYVKPLEDIRPEVEVARTEPIGVVQNLWRRFPPTDDKIMTPHIHIEVRTADGRLVDPQEYLRCA